MQKNSKSLWPDKLGVSTVPAPIKILREQCAVLEARTNGLLYGEVAPSSFPSTKGATYDFVVGVSGKTYRHKLFSIEVSLLFDYPVTIFNHEANTTVRADEDAFPKAIQRILGAEVTQTILSRLLAFASVSNPN